VTSTDVAASMLELARQRVAKFGLQRRVSVERLDLTQGLPSVPTGAFTLVTCCLGLHLFDADGLERLLSEIARVLRPGGVCVAAIWDTVEAVPMVDVSLRAAQDVSASLHASALPILAQFAHGGGRMDGAIQAAGLGFGVGHNTVAPMPVNLGPLDGEQAWQQGPLNVLRKLASAPRAEVDAVRDAFRRRCTAGGLVNDAGELEFTQYFRLLSLRKRRAGAGAAATAAAADALLARAEGRRQEARHEAARQRARGAQRLHARPHEVRRQEPRRQGGRRQAPHLQEPRRQDRRQEPRRQEDRLRR